MLDGWAERGSPLLIGGELVTGAERFETIDPATEEVIGPAAEATPGQLDQAIDAARRAFDETGWAADRALRVRCLRQLQDALTRHGGELRDLTVREAGAPRFLTHGAQLDAPVAELGWVARLAETHEWSRDLGPAAAMGIASRRRVLREPVGVVGAITPSPPGGGGRSGSGASGSSPR
ncbi:aldehyde dehydrogenase family protein [Nonomuraea sp. NPDC004297]